MKQGQIWRLPNFTSAALSFAGYEHSENAFIEYLGELACFLNTCASKQVKSKQYFP